MSDASWLRSLEPLLFDWLTEQVSAAVRRTVEAVRRAHKQDTAPAVLDLAVELGCDERNVRLHLDAIEAAIDKMATRRTIAQFSYRERGPGRKQPVRYEVHLNKAYGHSERFLHGFRRFAAETPEGGVVDGVDIYLLKRSDDAAAFPAGAVQTAIGLADLLREPGWQPSIHYGIADFEEQVWTATRPVFVLCGAEDLADKRLPAGAMFRSECPDGATPHEISTRRYDYVLVTRFVNEMDQPVMIAVSDGRFGHLAFKALLDNNVAAGMIFSQLDLDDDALAPREYQFRFRMEMHAHKNVPAGHGDPQVIRPFRFEPPARPKPPRPVAGEAPKLGIVGR